MPEDHVDYYHELLQEKFPVTISPLFPDVPENENVEISWDNNQRGIYTSNRRETELVLRGMFAVVQSLTLIKEK